MCATYIKRYTPHSSAKLNVVYFYICLSVHIMYMIHNKATFMVIEIINPIIRKSKNSTISDHLLALDKSRFRGNTNICLYLISINNTIQYFKINFNKKSKFVKNSAKYKGTDQIPLGILIEAQAIDDEFSICSFAII